MQATAWLAKASFSSTRSISFALSPVRSNSLRIAGIGPIPMTDGSTPATEVATTRASGFSPSARARPASITRRAAAPSLMPDAFPAVTLPPSINAGRSFARLAAFVSGRGCSSLSTEIGSPLRCGIFTGTISSACTPLAAAAAARRCDSRANASCSSRETLHCAATRSAVSPSEIVGYFASKTGFTNRQPIVVSTSSRVPRSYPLSGFNVTSGARLMLSTPPAITTSASPTAIACAALATA